MLIIVYAMICLSIILRLFVVSTTSSDSSIHPAEATTMKQPKETTTALRTSMITTKEPTAFVQTTIKEGQLFILKTTLFWIVCRFTKDIQSSIVFITANSSTTT